MRGRQRLNVFCISSYPLRSRVGGLGPESFAGPSLLKNCERQEFPLRGIPRERERKGLIRVVHIPTSLFNTRITYLSVLLQSAGVSPYGYLPGEPASPLFSPSNFFWLRNRGIFKAIHPKGHYWLRTRRECRSRRADASCGGRGRSGVAGVGAAVQKKCFIIVFLKKAATSFHNYYLLD